MLSGRRDEPGVDDLADEERVGAELDGALETAVEKSARPGEDGGAGRRGVGARHAVERPAVVGDDRGLHELADHGAVGPLDEGDRECPTARDQLVGERLPFDGDPDEFRLPGDLGDPGTGHEVAALPGTRSDEVDPRRHLPEDPTTELVVLVGVRARGEGTDEVVGRHSGQRTLRRAAGDGTFGRYRAAMARRIRYGPHRQQVGTLRLPRDADRPVPVVVLIHGGFWRAPYTRVTVSPLARALVRSGFAVWNIEYRRVGWGGGGGGVPATLEDVARAIDALADAGDAGRIDLGSVVTCGHSAGGQLALWAGCRPSLGADAPGGPVRVGLRGAVSLAGAVDLDSIATNPAVVGFLGADPEARARHLRLAAPLRHLPLGIPQVLVHGLADTVVAPAMSERYVAAAVAAGDRATFVGVPDVGHSDLISPRGPGYRVILDALWSITGPT